MYFKGLFLVAATFLIAFTGFSQSLDESVPDSLPDNVLLEKQWSLGAILHTNGWGIKFRKGKNKTLLKQWMWELEFSTYKAAKEYRVINPYYSDSKSYIYGKLNYLSFLRGGVGAQRVLNRKPYWGGVEVSLLYYGGISLGITKPVYLYIIHQTGTGSEYMISEEKYNPDIHFVDNIYGRASFLSHILNLGFYPGIYGKGGLLVDFGSKNRTITALEAGATLDFSPIPIPIMAYNPKQNLFLTLYIGINVGKRHN
ncbi:MAG TPA: hypothetical protein VMC08_04605 [Bacteroidales bacterium]|nr:hypothetical protein [Bacteroidales bacterium]